MDPRAFNNNRRVSNEMILLLANLQDSFHTNYTRSSFHSFHSDERFFKINCSKNLAS